MSRTKQSSGSRRNRAVWAAVVAALAAHGGALAQEAPAPRRVARPEEVQLATQILHQLGYAATPEGLKAAATSGDTATLIAALNAAGALGSDVLRERALRLRTSTNFALQLAAGKYLGILNMPEGAQIVRGFGEAKREYLLEDSNLQLLVIDAAREVARHGHPDYAYQLALLVEQGDWPVKTFAVEALREFGSPEDPIVENVWLRAIELYQDAMALEGDQEVRANAQIFMKALLESAQFLPAVTTKMVEAFEELAATRQVSGPGVRPLDFTGAAQRLKTLPVRNPRDEAPPLDPDPRLVAQTASESLLNILDKGGFETLNTDLDDRGVFEGMGKREWIEKVKAEWRPSPEGFERQIRLRAIRTSQQSGYEVLVEIQGDQFNHETRRWEAMTYWFRVTWWGYGWHFSGFERRLAPQQPEQIENLPPPALDERYPEAQQTALELATALQEFDLARLERTLAPDVVVNAGALNRDAFLEQIGTLFERNRGLVVFRAVGYTFTPTEDASALEARVDLRSYNRAVNRWADVQYHLRLERRGEGWLITLLSTKTERLETP